jgi:site-specific recombinase XerD
MSRSTQSLRRRVGRVTVYQRGGRYWIYYRNGRPIRRSVGTHRDEALGLAAKINAQLAEGAPTVLEFRPIDLQKLIAAWLSHHEDVRRSSLATVQRYRTAVQHLARFVAANRGALRVDRFTPDMAEEFVRHLRTAAVAPNGHPHARKRTMRDKGIVFILGTCRAFFNFAREQRHLPAYAANPFSRLGIERMPIEDSKPIRPLTPNQELKFFEACDDWQFRVFFVLAFTGLRVGELTHLLVDNDLSFGDGVLRVTNKPRLYWQIKTRNLRGVPLLPEVAKILHACVGQRSAGPVFLRRRFATGAALPLLAGQTLVQLEQELAARIENAQAAREKPLLRLDAARIGRAVWRDAGGVKAAVVRKEFMRVTKRMGLEHLTCPKDLRHLFATSLQTAGVDPLVRRDVMGHTTLQMTAHYTHTQDATRLREVSRLAEVRGPVLHLAEERCG